MSPPDIAGEQPLTPLQAALKYASFGWRVSPIADDAKKPITRHGFLDSTTDVTQITRWWTAHPTARIGLACRPNGLIAIDIDPRNGGDATFADLERDHGALPRTNHQRSGSGGEHVVLRDPSPGPDGWTRTHESGGSCRGKLGDGVDVKCNGYIVVEPSGTYHWLTLDPDNVAEFPTAWIALLQKPEAKTATTGTLGDGIDAWREPSGPISDVEASELREVLRDLGPRGAGKETTFRAIATIFHDYGRGLSDGERFLNEWNASNGSPHDESELDRQVRRISERKLDHARGWRCGLDEVRRALADAPSEPPAVVTDAPIARKRLGRRVATIAAQPVPPVRTYATGFPDLDRLLGGGLCTGQMCGVLGPPSLGKSAFVGSVALLVEKRRPMLLASTELTAAEMTARIAAHILNVPWRDCVKGIVPRAQQLAALTDQRITVIGCDDLFGDTTSRQDPLAQIEYEARAMTSEDGESPVIVIDYVQILARGTEDGMRARVGELSMTLRQMAQRLDTVVIAVFTISRVYYSTKMAAVMREADDPRAYLAAAKESGDIEYDCATILFLDVNDEVTGEGMDKHRDARIVVARCRVGDEGFAGAQFYPVSGRWIPDGTAIERMSPERRAARDKSARDQETDGEVAMLVAKVREGIASTPVVLRSRSQWRDSGVVANTRKALERALATGALKTQAIQRIEGGRSQSRDMILPGDWSGDPYALVRNPGGAL